MSWPDAAVVEVETADDALLAWRVVNTFMHVMRVRERTRKGGRAAKQSQQHHA